MTVLSAGQSGQLPGFSKDEGRKLQPTDLRADGWWKAAAPTPRSHPGGPAWSSCRFPSPAGGKDPGSGSNLGPAPPAIGGPTDIPLTKKNQTMLTCHNLEYRHSMQVVHMCSIQVVDSKLQVVPWQAVMLCFSILVASLTVSSGMPIFPCWWWVLIVQFLPLEVPECPSNWTVSTRHSSEHRGGTVSAGWHCVPEKPSLFLGTRKAITSPVSLAKARVLSYILLSPQGKDVLRDMGKKSPLLILSHSFHWAFVAIKKAHAVHVHRLLISACYLTGNQ